MKAQTRMIVASAVVIALALTAVSGVTYSWFTDTGNTEISVTTGTIDVKSEVNSTGIELKMTDAGGTECDNSDRSFSVSDVTVSGGTISITMKNILPGYQAWVPIKIWNGGKNQAQIMVSASAVKGESPTEDLTYSLLQNDKTAVKMNKFAAYDTERYVVGAEDKYGYIKIAMDSSLQDQTEATYKVTVKADAVQINASTDAVLEGLTLTKTATQIVSTNSQVSTIDVALTEVDKIENVTLKTVSTDEKGSYTIKSGETDTSIIGGIQVTSANEESKTALTSAKATLTFVFDGDLTGTTLYATHVPSSGGDTTTTKIESGVFYDKDTDKTTVTVDTTGFSTWYVSADANAIVDGKYMKLTTDVALPEDESKTTVIEKVLNSANSVIMLDDLIIDKAVSIIISKDVTLNLNGHKIINNVSEDFIKSFMASNDGELFNCIVISNNVTIIGTEPGSGIETDANLFGVNTHGVTFTVDGGEYIARNNVVYYSGYDYSESKKVDNPSTVNINGGTFRVKEAANTTSTISVTDGYLNINGGNFYCEYFSCIQSNSSDTTINGGNIYITGPGSAVAQSGGTLKITGGNFLGQVVDIEGDLGGELKLISCNNISSGSIEGGTFTAILYGNAYANLFYVGKGVTASMEVTGGTFTVTKGENATGKVSLIVSDKDETGKILAGGTYNVDPSSYLKKIDGYDVTAANDGNTGLWTVSVSEKAQSQ